MKIPSRLLLWAIPSDSGRKKNVNPSGSLTRRARRSTTSPDIALIDLFRSAAVVFVLIFDATIRMTRAIAHVPRSRGLEKVEGFINAEDSLSLSHYVSNIAD